jgi:hypothetical protein
VRGEEVTKWIPYLATAPDRWSLYADPSIFQVAVRTTDDGWIQMMLEVDPEGTQGVGICGTGMLSQDVANETVARPVLPAVLALSTARRCSILS